VVLGLADDVSGGEEPRYAEAPESAFLYGASGEALTRLVAECLRLDRRVWRRRAREWVRGPG
jgi:hypothetical protein